MDVLLIYSNKCKNSQRILQGKRACLKDPTNSGSPKGPQAETTSALVF